MLGAIAGDIIGSLHEFKGTKTTKFPLFTPKSFFTDDTVLTIATAEKLLRGGDYAALYRKWGLRYPNSGFGGRFAVWLGEEGAGPYNSFGNGSAMRVAPVGWVFNTLTRTLAEAQRSALVTHNHPEGVKGAQAVAAAIFMARTGKSKAEIKAYLEETFRYELSQSVAEIREFYMFDETCQGSVPQAIRCFLEGKSYEETVRLAVSLGGDADTQACIAGSIAEAAFGIPEEIVCRARARLPEEMNAVIDAFQAKFPDLRPSAKKSPVAQPARKRAAAPRIVIIDDCPRVVSLYRRCLEHHLDADIYATCKAEDALREALKRPPAVFISDGVHPDGPNGAEMVKILKSRPETRKTQVWVISGFLTESPGEYSADWYYKLGADLVLKKPCALDKLADRIKAVLAGLP